MPKDFEFRYLFRAVYDDGSFFDQTHEDVSSKGVGTCFSDVEHDRLSQFQLISVDGDDCYTVSLHDGHFEVNGVQFFMHDEELFNFRVIYFHRHRRHHRTTEDGEYVQVAHEVSYRLGWQANDRRGNNVQRIMEVV